MFVLVLLVQNDHWTYIYITFVLLQTTVTQLEKAVTLCYQHVVADLNFFHKTINIQYSMSAEFRLKYILRYKELFFKNKLVITD